MKSYTYCHIRNDTGKIFYIGLGSDNRRYKSPYGRNAYWNNIVKKANGFTYEILAYWDTREQAASHEILLIDSFKSMNYDLANMSSGGEKSALGSKLSKETRQKMSAIAKGKTFSPETRKKMSESAKVRAKTKESLNRLALGRLKITKEVREKIGKARIGKKHSLETKIKISNASSMHRHSEETKLKLSLKAKERCKNPEHLKNLSIAGKKGAETRKANRLASGLSK